MTDLRQIAADQNGRPVAPSSGVLRPLGIGEVRITEGFWAQLQDLNGRVIIDHAEQWMEKVGWIGNFDAALTRRLPQHRRGREFSDSDVYKLMEAMAWEIGRSGDQELEQRFNALVRRIAPVQEADGYLNTKFGRPGQQPRYSDLEWGHELYCSGHLIQAAVARARTHGHDEFVQIAIRNADHVCQMFGPTGIDTIDGHPEIEPALAELSRLTGDRKYLDQAQLFLDRRGHGRLAPEPFGSAYFQDDVPVRDASVLRGHAVRALYLTAGAVDVATETGDEALLEASLGQMRTTVARRTYLTGGMGAHHEDEAFGTDYELPPDRAYSETCAGIAAAMAAQRMLLATGASEHADLIERVLFNVVAAAPAQDGRGFFYTNTLHQRSPGTEAPSEEPSARAASSMRAPWFAVSCCPTNVARTLASLGSYLATVNDDGLQIHQYASASISTTLPGGDTVALQVQTDYPHSGAVRVQVMQAPEGPWSLSLRIPAWADGARVTIGDRVIAAAPGYVQLDEGLRTGAVAELLLPVQARWTWPDPRIDAVRGQVAVERGPLVLCMESADLGSSVNEVSVHTGSDPADDDAGVRVVAQVEEHPQIDWPYGNKPERDADEPRQVALLPYYQWGNRGPSTMRVWLPVD